MSGVGHDEAGLVSGLLTTSHEIGIALVLPVLSTIAVSGSLGDAFRAATVLPAAGGGARARGASGAPTSRPGRVRPSCTKFLRRARRRRTQHRGDPRRGRAGPRRPPRRGDGRDREGRGVARQTVYAHFTSREALLNAVAERALAQTLAAIDAAEPERGDAAEALDRLVAAWWGSVARHARVLEALASAAPSRGWGPRSTGQCWRASRHWIERGDFDGPTPWLAAAFLGLMHTAAEEVAAGRLSEAAAGEALARSIPRLFGSVPTIPRKSSW